MIGFCSHLVRKCACVVSAAGDAWFFGSSVENASISVSCQYERSSTASEHKPEPDIPLFGPKKKRTLFLRNRILRTSSEERRVK